jgi:proteic killer suppression protein
MGRIKTFSDYETQKIYHQFPSKKLPKSIQSVALRKLIMLDNAETLNDLWIPPSNHLEKLQGDRSGQYSIRINLKYRICFSCKEDGYYDVEICDYH